MKQHTGICLLAAALATATLSSGCSKSPQAVVTSPATRASDGHITDINVTEHVKSAFQQNDALKAFDITVETLKGDVRLSGKVNTQAQMDEAIRIARASDGAHTIHNELTLQR